MQNRVKPGQKTVLIAFRAAETDMIKWREHAEKCGQDFSSWLRAACKSRARRAGPEYWRGKK